METKNTNTKKIVIALVVLAVILAGAFAAYHFLKPDTNEGSKTITLAVVFAEDNIKTYTLKTDGEYLLDELKTEPGLLTDADITKGYITTLGGVAADEAKMEWWCITKDGGNVDFGMKEQPIADGEKYEITLTTGW